MIIMWVCSSVNFMIIDLYIKYIPGGTYINFFIAGVAEITANITAGVVFAKFGPRITYGTAFIISLAGGSALIFQEKYTNDYLIAFFVLMAKFGSCMSMCCCYVSTPWVFPILVCGTAFGICNLFGRFTQAAGPIIAELEIPKPMEAFSGIAVIGLIGSIFLRIRDD